MESIPLEMDNIFGDYDDDDDGAIPRRLPDLDEMETDLQPMVDRSDDERNEEDMTDNPELLAKLKGMQGASKHVARRTYPKLDATRLTGERGIATLPTIFKDIPLKGKHHEAEDLKVIMHHMEHWAHRLFPKMPFGEVLERAERLGAKKEVQTCVKRIRLGMPVLPTDFEADGDDQVQRVGEDSPEHNVPPNDDEIESLIQEQEEIERQSSQASAWDMVREHQASKLSQQEDEVSSQILSDDAKERIERNKRLAMEKRAARLGKMSSQDTSSQVSVSAQASSADNCQAGNTETHADPLTVRDQQTFESAIEILEDADDDIESAPEEQNLIMDIDLTSSQNNDSNCDTDKDLPVPQNISGNLDPNSQESDEEISLCLNDIDDSVVIKGSHDAN